MKKLICLLLVAILAFTLFAACSDKDKEADNDSNPSSDADNSETPPASYGDINPEDITRPSSSSDAPVERPSSSDVVIVG